jgi:ERCC4-type nuclease
MLVVLLIDNRAGSKQFNEKLRRMGIQTSLEDLKIKSSDGVGAAADFAWGGNGPEGPVMVGVERKQLRELTDKASIKRWAGQQLLMLLDNYHYIVLVVEGVYRPRGDRVIEELGWDPRAGKKTWQVFQPGRRLPLYSEVHNLLNSLSYKCNVEWQRSYNEDETAEIVACDYSWWQKEWDAHTSFKQIYAPVKGPVALLRPCLTWRMVAQIDGIDYELGNRLRKMFRTPREMVMASEDDWCMIKGISRETAKRIRRELGH